MSRFFFKNPEFPLNVLILKDIVDLFFMAEFQSGAVKSGADARVGMQENSSGKERYLPQV